MDIANRIISNLIDRGGFSDWWENLDDEIQYEIKAEIREEINTPQKICIITTHPLYWSITVDGKTLDFFSGKIAEQFAELYKKLGYTIEYNKEV